MTATSIELMRAAMAHMDSLLQQPEAERAAFLNELLISQPPLHAMVVKLLKAERDASGSGFLEPALHANSTSRIKPDMQLGPYRIIKQLGAGGMGEVWLASRVDGLYGGEVAIKTLHPHLANTAVRERFAREAHILGKLTHKNIARLHDAGVTGAGVTYLVLEYVNGEGLDSWCDARSLTIRARLELFLSVCAAVAHAHAHLIVHRDLKPSNILVARAGGVKLLDFGVAKLVQGDVSNVEPTALTQFGGRIFTPEYAAPEQILGEAVTTATDVYALGVVLYALLSGKRPFGSPGITGRELEREILTAEPSALPTLPSEQADEIARERSTTPSKLASMLKGDLEYIVSRALRKLPKDRYGSVLALAVDIERYLRRQPVEAREGSSVYRFSRLLQRHRAATFATMISVSALLAGSAVALWQMQVAREQAQVAALEASKATAVKEFLLDIFNANSQRHPDGARARQTTAEELLDVASQTVLVTTDLPAETRAELMGVLSGLNLTLEKYEQSEALHRGHVKLLGEQFGMRDRRLVEPMLDLAEHLRARGRFDEAREQAQQALSILDGLNERISVLRGLAEVELGQIAYGASNGADTTPIAHFQNAIRILEQLPASHELVRATLGLARTYELRGELDKAIALNLDGIEIAIRVHGSRHTSIAGGHQQLARVLAASHRLAEAETQLAQAIEIFEYLVGSESGFTTMARLDAGRMQLRRGKHREAIAGLESVLAIRTKVDGPSNHWVQETRFALASALLAAGDFPRAQLLLDSGLEVLANSPKQNLRVLMLRARAALALEQRRPRDALRDIELAKQILDTQNDHTVRAGAVLVTHAEVLSALDRDEEAKVVLDQALALLHEKETDPARPETAAAHLVRAQIEFSQGNFVASQVAVTDVLNQVGALDRRQEQWVLEETAQRRLAAVAISSGKHIDACRSLDVAIKLRVANALPSDPRLAASRELKKKYCTT